MGSDCAPRLIGGSIGRVADPIPSKHTCKQVRRDADAPGPGAEAGAGDTVREGPRQRAAGDGGALIEESVGRREYWALAGRF